MRQIFLDTETTGLSPEAGHRIIEIAAVECINRRVTQKHYHQYINPERDIDEGAQEVHGITLDFLQDKPKMQDVVEHFLNFVTGAELIIHNAPFDVGFLNMELGRLGKPKLEQYVPKITDTLKMAKEMRPGQRNNLDALCRFYEIDNSKRTLHGALLDAELLAEVYMAMTRGQESLMISVETLALNDHEIIQSTSDLRSRIILATEEELMAHEAYLAGLEKSGSCLWKKSE